MHTSFTLDPAWPRIMPGMGPGTLALAAAILVALTIWTYLGARRTSWSRVAIVLGLRLVALVVTVLLILRPSLAFEEEEDVEPSRLIILIDDSLSMATRDELNSESRLEAIQRLLTSSPVDAALKRLDAKKVERIYYLAADKLERFVPDSKPQGKHTDIGRWLDDVVREHGRDKKVQAVLLLSDGGDTGDSTRTLQKAADFRGRFPIHTFGVGQSNAGGQERDIALEQIFMEPKTILAKGKFKVKVVARAPGFENARTDVSLWIEERATGKMREIKRLPQQRFEQASSQEIELEADAPDEEGEVRLTVKADKLPDESRTDNNEISTFAHVSKEGVRVLWVEGQQRWEFAIPIRECLRKDRRFQVVADFRPKLAGPAAARADNVWDKTYDVLVIGDIPASRLGDITTQLKIRDRVEKQGMGVLMLGGYETFANSDWQLSAFQKDFFPVKLDQPGQIEGKVRVKPERDGLAYVLKLSDDEAKNQEIWEKKFEPLDGVTRPGSLARGATALATCDVDPALPILATVERGKGRVMTFAGDTTWRAWRRNPEAAAGFDRFWKQMMLWLAHQENSQGNLILDLAARRIDRGRGQNLAFRVGFRGVEVKNPLYAGKVIGPRKEEYPLIVPTDKDKQGVFQPAGPGEYTIIVSGKGTQTKDGAPIEGKAQARFIVYEEDRETQRIAADHEFLDKLALASGGKFARAEERTLEQRLDELEANRVAAQKKTRHWPDWRRTPAGDSIGEQFSALWQSSALACLLVYLVCLCLEWYLRRRWGMV
jgi:uncharacterized membrane protein